MSANNDRADQWPGAWKRRHVQKRGQKLPSGVKSVARPSRWGNPYKVGSEIRLDGDLCLFRLSQEMAVALYSEHTDLHPPDLRPLRAATGLACYCHLDDPCHADVLIELLWHEWNKENPL